MNYPKNQDGLADIPENDPIAMKTLKAVDAALATLAPAEQMKSLTAILMAVSSRLTSISQKQTEANAVFQKEFGKEAIAKKKQDNLKKWGDAVDAVANQKKLRAAKEMEAMGFQKVFTGKDGSLKYFHKDHKGYHVILKTEGFEVTKNDAPVSQATSYQAFGNVISNRKNWN